MAKKNIKGSAQVSTAAIPALEGRMPPQAVDIEVAVLGAILLEQDAYSSVSEIISPSSFYVPAHESIYVAMTALALDQKPVDMLTVTEELRRTEKLDEVGGPAYIASLTQKVYSAANLEYHAHILAKKALSRRLISFSSQVLQDAYEDREDIAEQMQRAEGLLFEIAQNGTSKDFSDISPLIKEALEEIQKATNNKDGLSGITSGFSGIDKMTAGWQRSDLIIIAARPAMGKTAFVVSMAKMMAVDYGIPVALFNLEMSGVQLVKRLLSNVCEIEGEAIKSGRLSDDQWRSLYHNLKQLDTAPLYINDTPSLSVFELRSKARRLVREYGVQMIIIDYLQLMNASGMGFGNREQEVSIISRSLKVLAKELNIPIVALSQLNRGVENRQGDANSKRPQLSDLRESGAIEQDADIVCFIHRPEYYGITEDPQTGASLIGLADFIIAKHRNGPVGDVRLSFLSNFTKFTSLQYAPAQLTQARRGQDGAPAKTRRKMGESAPSSIETPLPTAPAPSFDPLSGDGGGFDPSADPFGPL